MYKYVARCMYRLYIVSIVYSSFWGLTNGMVSFLC